MENKQLERLLDRTGDVALRRRAFWILRKVLKIKPKQVLDIGCGDGFYLHLMSALIPKSSLSGLDNDANALNSAKRNLKGRQIVLKKGSIYKLPFKDRSFDVVIVSEVMEHLEDENKAISEIFRVLKSSGTVLISVPHANYPFFWDPINWILERVVRTHIKSGFWAGIWNQHIRLYPRKDLIYKLKEHRFKRIESSILTNFCLPFNHYLLNLAARFLVNQRGSSVAQAISKFNNSSGDDILKVSPFRLFFWLDKFNDHYHGDTGVSLVVSANK